MGHGCTLRVSRCGHCGTSEWTHVARHHDNERPSFPCATAALASSTARQGHWLRLRMPVLREGTLSPAVWYTPRLPASAGAGPRRDRWGGADMGAECNLSSRSLIHVATLTTRTQYSASTWSNCSSSATPRAPSSSLNVTAGRSVSCTLGFRRFFLVFFASPDPSLAVVLSTFDAALRFLPSIRTGLDRWACGAGSDTSGGHTEGRSPAGSALSSSMLFETLYRNISKDLAKTKPRPGPKPP